LRRGALHPFGGRRHERADLTAEPSPMTYRAPVRDLAFTLQAVAGIDRVAATGAFPDYDPEVMGAVLEAAAQFSEEVLAPLNRVGDAHGSKCVDGNVTTAPGFADAYRQFAAGGWTGLSAPAHAGGQQLPKALELAAYETVDRKSTRLNSSHVKISYAVFCLK